MRKIRIGPGEHYVTQQPNELLVTVLGSCVAACIRDPGAGIGGMNHFMLPESSSGMWGGSSANMRYGNYAMERLINDILRGGGQRARLEVKLFGGASLIAQGSVVGYQNADFVEAYLAAEKMTIVAAHLRGSRARRIEYMPLAGRVMMLEMGAQAAPVARSEDRFLKSLRARSDGGTIDLFETETG